MILKLYKYFDLKIYIHYPVGIYLHVYRAVKWMLVIASRVIPEVNNKQGAPPTGIVLPRINY